MFDLLNEILETMGRNKLRTALTGFAVAWGMFMLIVLLGGGTGVQNGVQSNFEGNAINTVSLYPVWSSMPYKGLRANRRIRFDERTVDFVRRHVPEVEYITGYIYRQTTSVSYGEEYGTWRIEACMPEVRHIQYYDMPAGRFLNEADQKHRRKVCVVGKATVDVLFMNGEDPLGKHINIDGIAFQVVGVYDTPWNPSNSPAIFIPMSTGSMLYDRGWGVSSIEFTVRDGAVTSLEEGDALEARIRQTLGPHLGFDPADTSAMYIRNSAKYAVGTQSMFRMINIFLWVLGLASLVAGIVGVGNIMLVTVNERTREIGIRKALGATPWSIVRGVVVEAVFITTAAGYAGIMAGLGVVELAAYVLGGGAGAEGGMTAFKDPGVSLGVVFAALVVLVASGVVAGLVPSIRATKIRPIEAMRAE
ncbi:MAG: ABC transporter permease [Alistipes sp.]|jgi:putative ABC transport system permease protein|nr:ABC transporter permease [Alistipes sp.]